MKSFNLLVAFLCFFILSSNCSALNINWYYTNTLSNEDINFIRTYCSELVKKNEEIKFFLIDLNSGYKVQVNLGQQMAPTFKNTENKKFKLTQDLLSYCDSVFQGENCFLYANVKNDIPSIQRNLPSSKDFRKIVRINKKVQSSELRVLYFNGFKPYKSSKERYLNRLSYAKNNNDYSGLNITLLNNKKGSTTILRPDEKYYTLVFDSIGIFDEYELEIKCLSETAEGIWIKERIKFSDFDSQEDLVLYYTGELRECRFKINEKLLGWKCYEFSKILDTEEIPEMEDENCDECKLKCLYKKKFSISIMGLSEGFKDEKAKVICSPLLFQCTRSLDN
jgi:hypothetical protein